VIRVLSYNITYGGTGREAALAAVIRAAAPDVVMLQEATDPAVVRALAETTGLAQWGARPGHSTGFLSRLPVASHAWHHPRGSRHAFLEVELTAPALRLFGLHLSAWFSKWSERRRAREIRALLDGIRAHQEGFHLLAGDFNALAPGARLDVRQFPRWIRAMIWASGRDIGRDTIQTMLDRHYVDAWRVLRAHEDGYSFPTWDPHVRLDYFFTPARYAGRIARCEVFSAPPEAREASDHFPLLVELSTDGRGGTEPQGDANLK
jgi:exodeoxyribonuclease-3